MFCGGDTCRITALHVMLPGTGHMGRLPRDRGWAPPPASGRIRDSWNATLAVHRWLPWRDLASNVRRSLFNDYWIAMTRSCQAGGPLLWKGGGYRAKPILQRQAHQNAICSAIIQSPEQKEADIERTRFSSVKRIKMLSA
jgi:hypothetical protein